MVSHVAWERVEEKVGGRERTCFSCFGLRLQIVRCETWRAVLRSCFRTFAAFFAVLHTSQLLGMGVEKVLSVAKYVSVHFVVF